MSSKVKISANQKVSKIIPEKIDIPQEIQITPPQETMYGVGYFIKFGIILILISFLTYFTYVHKDYLGDMITNIISKTYTLPDEVTHDIVDELEDIRGDVVTEPVQCYIGEYDGKRSCAQVLDKSLCTSGDVFETRDECISQLL